MSEDSSPFVKMGYIRGAVGIKGWVKIKADTETPDSLLDYTTWYLGQDNNWIAYQLEDGVVNNNGLQAKLIGVDNRNIAETLQGLSVAIPRSSFAKTEEGEYYWVDLVGMRVVNPQGELLGTVDGLFDSVAHDILLVKNNTLSQPLMIPFIDIFILEVDQDNRQITADWQVDY